VARTGAKAAAVPDQALPANDLVRTAHRIGGEDLPRELGFGSGMTCWRRLERWNRAGVFDQLHRILLANLNAAAMKGYDSGAFGPSATNARPSPIIPSCGTTGIKGIGKLRYVVEQTFALLHQSRRLAVHWERRLDIHQGFVTLGCALICWPRVDPGTTKILLGALNTSQGHLPLYPGSPVRSSPDAAFHEGQRSATLFDSTFPLYPAPLLRTGSP